MVAEPLPAAGRSAGCGRRLALGLAVWTLTASAAQEYRGFIIDEAGVSRQPDVAAIVAAAREQIDMVQAVGLPADTLAFLQQVEFELVPTGTFNSPTPGRYTGQTGRQVQVAASIVKTGHKPVLLHELLHAYHDQRMAQGYKNPALLHLYRKAQAIPAFAARSHMMANEKEYFACSATAYLFGVTAQEPFTRAKLREHQPECFAFLQALFGPDAGRYEGSLSRPP